MKTLYLIPGYRHDLQSPGYLEIKNFAESRGYRVVFVPILWKYNTMSDYITQAEKYISSSENASILGFSFGAMITLKLSEKYKFQKVFLCSLSPYFAEDLPKLPLKWKLSLGIRRWNDFYKNYSEKDIVNSLRNIFCMIYGDKESEFLQDRNRIMQEQLRIENIVILENVGHDISDPKYLSTIGNNL